MTPYPRSADFDTDIGAFIESSTVPLSKGLMARLVVKENITSGGALAPGQTLRLGEFTLTPPYGPRADDDFLGH